jgi:Fe2+ or Zn2+ uptake regulation protein
MVTGMVARRTAKAPGSAARPTRQATREERVASMLARVRERGLKLTPQRLAIVQELAGDPTHPTAQELFERLLPGLPTMSFATVYNTLDALRAAGACVSLSFAPGAARFDPNMGEHHHAVCDRCGLVRDVPAEAAEASAARAVRSLAAAPGFEIRSVERVYRGLCAACARGEARGSKRS